VDSASNRVWGAGSGSLDGSVVGLNGLTLDVRDLTATINSRASDGTYLDLTRLDLGDGQGYTETLVVPTGAGSVSLPLSTAVAQASTSDARLALGGNVLVHGGLSVTQRTVDVDIVPGGTIEDLGASLLDASISGGSLFFGAGASFDSATGTIDTANAAGFSASGVDAELAVIKPRKKDAGDKTSYFGLQASISSTDLTAFV